MCSPTLYLNLHLMYGPNALAVGSIMADSSTVAHHNSGVASCTVCIAVLCLYTSFLFWWTGKFNLGVNNAGCNAFFNNEDAVVAKSSKVKDRDSAEAPKVALHSWRCHGHYTTMWVGKNRFLSWEKKCSGMKIKL